MIDRASYLRMRFLKFIGKRGVLLMTLEMTVGVSC